MEELASFSSRVRGLSHYVSVPVEDDTKNEAIPVNPGDQDGLESFLFADRAVYKTTALCMQREQQFSLSKKSGLSSLNLKRTSQTAASPLSPDSVEADASFDDIELKTVLKKSDLKRAHPADIVCEGCRNAIDFGKDYETIITYKATAQKDLLYFHDDFCVTLRRLKESIRRFVMDAGLPESRRAETTIGYMRNLFLNFNTLISTDYCVPRPNPLSGHALKGDALRLAHMSFIRSNANKLILRQQALDNRQAKNFEDEYSWKFKELPQSLQYANMSIYGACLAKLVVHCLLSKQLEPLWLTLAFVVSGMTATESLQIVEEHRTDLAKVKEMEHLDLVLTSMIEAADYTIAMALYLSDYMTSNAENDLSRSADFEKVANKYIQIASELVASVESDHLLSLLLETPTDIAHLSVFEIAIKYGISDFMDNSRIQMLMTHMWSEFEFLDPSKNFRTQDIALFELISLLTKQPAKFYYCPVGRYWVESVMYMAYVCVVSAVVYETNYDLSSPISTLEWTMWIFNAGFIIGEITQMAFDGLGYLTDVGNVFDVLIMINWALLAMCRFACKNVYSDSEQCNASTTLSYHDGFTVEDAHTRNRPAVMLYSTIFCAQICILWSRVCLIFSTNRNVGPFVSMIPGMVTDILKWAFVLSIFYIGYSFGTYFLIAGDVTEACGVDDGSLDTFSVVAEYNFILLMGQSEWSVLEANDCMSPGRSLVVKLYMYGFSILGTVLLLNLLIAMMASTYEKIREGTAKQVNFARAEETFGMSHSNAIIPPPLNVIVFALSILWFAAEFLLMLCTCFTFILNIEKLVPLSIDYAANFPKLQNKNSRNLLQTPLRCCNILQRLKNPKYLLGNKLAKNYSSTARYCQFCRVYMRVNGNIAHYFKLFVNYRLDEADVKFMQSLMQNAGICPHCYRPYRIYEKTENGIKSNRLFRWQVVLELLSFFVFMVVLWLPLIILVALPALFGALFSFVDDVKQNTKIVAGNRASLVKDDKYVQLVENIIEKEGTTDTEVLSTQVSQLNRKLIQIKMSQQKAASVLAEHGGFLADHKHTLSKMKPYIVNIDSKMDKTMSTQQQLHQQQLSVFEHGMERQSVKILQSKDLLDVHTDYNKQHQQRLQEQRLIAEQHHQEMTAFKAQLDELRTLRARDEVHKQGQAARQEALEKQHAQELQSFNKELKQQRVLREMEAAKQEKNNTQQREEMATLHQEQLASLQAEIVKQQKLREEEERKIREEQEKRELLNQQQVQDMAILQSQLQQLRVLKEAEDKKREIELKLRKQQEQKMKSVEQEILRIKQQKKQFSAQRKSDASQQAKQLDALQKQLHDLEQEKRKNELKDKQNKETQEIREIHHQTKVTELKQQMSLMIREQEHEASLTKSNTMRQDKERMQHQIHVEKMKHSMNRLETSIKQSSYDIDDDDGDGDDENNPNDSENQDDDILDSLTVGFKKLMPNFGNQY